MPDMREELFQEDLHDLHWSKSGISYSFLTKEICRIILVKFYIMEIRISTRGLVVYPTIVKVFADS